MQLVYKQYQEKSEVLHTFTPKKSDACLLIVESSNLVLFKSHNTEFDQVISTFTGQNGRPIQLI